METLKELHPITQIIVESTAALFVFTLFAFFIIMFIWAFNKDTEEKREQAKYLENLPPNEQKTIQQWENFKKINAKLFKRKKKDK